MDNSRYKPVPKEPTMFEEFDFEPWKDEWQNMPEFEQHEMKPYAQVIIRFANQADLDDFCKVIGQKIVKGKESQSIWHPARDRSVHTHMQSDKRYVDES